MIKKCLFCNLKPERILEETEYWLIVRDGYPVSAGHTLIIPKRHIASFFELKHEEFEVLQSVMDKAKKLIDEEFHPDGFNIGVNNGKAAGQTVFHLHIHLIPRYEADMDDPRGGIRWVLPEKADYWSD